MSLVLLDVEFHMNGSYAMMRVFYVWPPLLRIMSLKFSHVAARTNRLFFLIAEIYFIVQI